MDLRHEMALAAATALGVIGCASAERAAAPVSTSPAPVVETQTAEDAPAEGGEALAPSPGLAAPQPVPAAVSPEAEAPVQRQQRVSCGASCGGSCGEPDDDDDDDE